MKNICSLLICVMIVTILSNAKTFENKDGGWRRDSLHAISIKERDAYLYGLWELYNSSNSLERPKVAEEMRAAVTKLAYLDSRIDMLGLFLFGPKHKQSILRFTRDKKSPLVDDQQCLDSTLKLFKKHCGVLAEESMKQSLANICNYVVEKEAIKEAIIIACECDMQNSESHGIAVENPKIDITPAPIHGSFEYCGRVYVNGTSRLKLWSYLKAYKISVAQKSIDDQWHNMIQVCFHRNDSQGFCQCEKDDWKSLVKGSWSFVMSPFEQRFIDVKFAIKLQGLVTVTLDEVFSPGFLYGLLVGGVALLFMAISKARLLILPSLPRHESQQDKGMADTVGKGALQLTRHLVAELAASPEFEEWMMNNAHRIRIGP